VADLTFSTAVRNQVGTIRYDWLHSELSSIWVLQDLLSWGARQSPSCDVVDVVIQDEYTHDVVFNVGDVFLVFDTT
jgi:hypothetical protein